MFSGEKALFKGLKLLGSLVTGSGKHGRLSILIYHRVLPRLDPMRPDDTDAEEFERQLQGLVGNFNVLSLPEAIVRLRSQSLPARAACVTFDDGYADNATVALPILQRWGVPATFFISTGFLDGGCMWNDALIEAVRLASGAQLDLTSAELGCPSIATMKERRLVAQRLITTLKYIPPVERDRQVQVVVESASAVIPNNLMMRSDQVRLLSDAGMTIGAHTVTHPILTTLGYAAARKECADGKDQLEALTGSRVSYFAYPNGKPGQDFNFEHVQIVKDLGFTAALSTTWGAATISSDPYQLPRFTPWDKNAVWFTLRLFHNCLRSRVKAM